MPKESDEVFLHCDRKECGYTTCIICKNDVDKGLKIDKSSNIINDKVIKFY